MQLRDRNHKKYSWKRALQWKVSLRKLHTIAPTLQREYKSRTHTHTHTPASSLLCMSLPKANIFGLPCTEVIMSQALINASLVQVLSRQLWSIEFCCLEPKHFIILSWTPSGIMPKWNRSKAMVLASISDTNRSRYSFRTSWAEWKEKIAFHSQFNLHISLPCCIH